MPTPIGTGPNGGVLVQEDDGTQHEIVGNKVTKLDPYSLTGGDTLKSFVNGVQQGWVGREGVPAEGHETADNIGRFIGGSTAGLLKPASRGYTEAKEAFTPAPAKTEGGPDAPVVDIKPTEQPPAQQVQPAPVASSGGGSSSKAPTVDTKDFDKATQDAQDAQRRMGQSRADAARAEGDVWTKHAEESTGALQKFQADMKAAQAEGERRLAEENAEIDKLGSGKVDPDHYWKSKGAGGKVLGSLALALGGLAHGMGAENIGAKMIAEDVDRDIKAQQFNIEQANETQKAKIAAKGTAFGHFLQLTGNAQTAALATKAWQFDNIKAKAEGMRASLTAPAEIAAADKLIAEMGQKAAENKNQAVLLNSQLKSQDLAQQQARLGIEHTRLQLQQQRAVMAAQQAGALLPEQRERAVFHPSGPILVADAHEARRLRPMVASADETLREIGKMKQLAQQWGSSSNRTEAGAAYALALDTVVKNINQSEGIGQALQKEQIELYKHALGNAATVPTAATMAALGKLEQSIRGSVNSQLEQAGGRAIYGAEPTEAQAAALKKAGR